MMEVKQNTAVGLNELLAPVQNTDGTDEVDDVVMTDLTEETHDLNCDLLKSNEKSNNGLVTNGDETLSSLIDLDSTAAEALEAPVSTELEDALLAEDDVLPKLTDVKVTSEPSSSVAVDDILADKVETSNSTTSSNNIRDPGDDLDTLLSKINDIVEDCLENEIAEAAVDEESEATEEKGETTATDITTDTKGESFDESVIVLEDTILEDSCIENDKTSQVEGAVDTEKELNEQHQEAEKAEKAEAAVAIEAEEETEVPSTQVDKIPDENVLLCENSTESETTQVATKEADSIETVPTEKASAQTDSTDSATIETPTTDTFSTAVLTTSTTECTTSTTNITETTTEDKVDELDEEVVDKNNEDDLLEDIENDLTANDVLSEAHVEEDANLLENESSPLPIADDEQSKDKDDTEKSKIDTEQESKTEEHATKNADQEAKIADKESKHSDQESKNEEHVSKNVDQKSTIDGLRKAKIDSVQGPIDDKADTKKDQEKEDEKVENEDSDDEIVFYVDKPPETEKNKATVEAQLKTTTSSDAKPEVEQQDHKAKSTDDDDVVILDDDEEMPIDKKGPEESSQAEDSTVDKTPAENQNEKSSSATNETDETVKEDQKHSTIDIDNSDNARDDFVVTEKGAEESNKPQEPEETNSNCSSSSNLLLEAKQNENTGDEPTQEENDNENEEEDDDGDVELIETESKEAENSSEKGEESSEIVPPAKRPRLSEDSEVSSKTDETSRSQKTSESVEKKTEIQTEASTTSTTTSLKRTHDVIELELDDDKSNDSKTSSTTETLNKKARTEDETTPKEDNKFPIAIDLKKLTKIEDDCKEDAKKDTVKMIPSEVPIPLYPPPKFKTLSSGETFSLDFLKKFRKSFDKMTKQDLEELVLQKVVEAIIHRSEFADMRELIEKQEKLITSHRSKISELSKQFRDLEMVHNRVVKDIEQRNSQFIMPVKITRAVGLQVYIPNKKAALESTASGNTTAVPPSPQRVAASAQSSLTSPQRQYHSTQTADGQMRVTGNSASSNTANSSAATASAVQRRGCAQKITPIRPVPASSTTASGSSSSASSVNTQVYRNNLNANQISSQPRILNKNASTAAAGATSNTNASQMQRPRYIPSSQDTTQRLQQQQQHQQQQQISRTTNNAANSQRAAAQQKLPTNPATAQRRPEPTSSTGSNNAASLDNYMNTLSQLTGGNTAVSITPAKPKEKAVIDLTDEDETPPAPPITSPQQTNNVSASQGQRRSLPVQSSNTNSTFGRTAPPLARIPPAGQMANSNKNRQMALQGQKNNSSFASTISTPPGTSITRINVAANTQGPQRVKYSHPAPLPATPPQAFNPSWKLPPPRPTIRISNLDNGIVISWTMEESMDRHAECVSYQIYAYQETSGPPMADSWRHVGDVKAMLLPMAVTLTQFQEGQRYFFAVRAVDCHQRYGPFSLPKTWS